MQVIVVDDGSICQYLADKTSDNGLVLDLATRRIVGSISDDCVILETVSLEQLIKGGN